MAAVAINQIVSAHAHYGDTWRDGDPALASGEGLLVHMGVQEQTGEGAVGVWPKHGTIGQDHVPPIGIVLPAYVGMLYSDVKSPRPIGSMNCPYMDYVGIGGSLRPP